MKPPAGLLVLFMLGTGGACLAADVKPSPSDARPSMPFSGTATMRDDGSLTLRLRLDSTGKQVDETLTYKTTDRGYDDVLRHLGALDPGDSRDFDPWKD